MRDLTGKVAVVIGCSAEAGTGWAIAEALAEAGAKVVVAARSFDRVRDLADRIGGSACACDIAREEQVQAVAERALSAFGRLDIAVNSAGLCDQFSIDDATEAGLRRTLEINYFGNVWFVKHMARAIDRDGSIIIISSLSTTHTAYPFIFAYAGAKSSTDCLVRYAAREYGPRNIRINSLLPGPIYSDMSRDAFARPGFLDAHVREVPLGRVAYPADYADAVLWLAGPAFITGANIPLCGGIQLNRFPYLDELPGVAPLTTLHERSIDA